MQLQYKLIMNHRKHKQKENHNNPKRAKYGSYSNDPDEAKCPYCQLSKRPCSYMNSLSRAYARKACSEKTQNAN